ncbi:MAG: long-chain fatty acid--CoA ligase [Chloracidobacterium sp.]|nr:long-chain fatty acid--CoA ligase [Chloracidobacterium sp.]MDW8218089.1 long-chain fatty acid--CoA ligase [Acidobacteriota bacterium]
MTVSTCPPTAWLAARARLSPDKTALIDAQRGYAPVTYGAWFRRVNQTVRFLRDGLGVQPGDRVAVLARNRVEYLDVWFALGHIGGVLQNLNWRLSRRELAAILADAAPVALLYDAPHAALAAELAAEQSPPLRRVAFDAPDADTLAFGERDTLSAEPPPPPSITAEAPWVLCYTGGSTGTPKGAVLSHRAIFANAVNTVLSWGLRPDDVTLLDAPLFHTGGLNVLTAPLVAVGGTSIVTGGFAPDQTFDAVERHGVTILFGVPTMFIELQRHPRWATADFSRLRFIISGGAPCPMSVFEAFWAKGVAFKTGYGLTEAGPNNFWLPEEQVREKPGAVGYPLWSVEARIVRSDGVEAAPDEVGELCLRGPHLFSGYWNNPAATAAAVDADGWLHTGDLAARDADGCFRIVGRLKEMFISGGENVYPAEVESVLHEHPSVVEAAVVGVPDPKWGEVGAAFVVLTGDASDDELTAFCRARLAGYKVPKRFIRLPALPRTGAHKIDKAALRRRITEERL